MAPGGSAGTPGAFSSTATHCSCPQKQSWTDVLAGPGRRSPRRSRWRDRRGPHASYANGGLTVIGRLQAGQTGVPLMFTVSQSFSTSL